jgi:hypothetical protein
VALSRHWHTQLPLFTKSNKAEHWKEELRPALLLAPLNDNVSVEPSLENTALARDGAATGVPADTTENTDAVAYSTSNSAADDPDKVTATS